MADTTPVYGLPYQELGDAPDGPSLGEDLAGAVETELVRIDAAVAAINGLSVALGTENTTQPTYSSTTFTAGSNNCAAAFVAPPSGSVVVYWKAYFEATINDKMAFVGCEIRSGATPGGGSQVVAANSTDTVAAGGTVTTSVPVRHKGATFKVITSLTPGAAYHARLMHQAESGGGSIIVHERQVMVVPVL